MARTKPISESEEKPKTSEADVKPEKRTDAESVLADIAKTTSEFSRVSGRDVQMNPVKIDLAEEFPCISVTYGGLSWRSPKTNFHFRWNDFGSVVYLSFDELLTLNNSSREFLFRPLIIVQDSKVVEYFRLLNLYENVWLTSQLEEAFKKSPEEINQTLDKILQANMREVAIAKIRQMRRDKTLTNIDVIKIIEKKLYFDLLLDDSQGR